LETPLCLSISLSVCLSVNQLSLTTPPKKIGFSIEENAAIGERAREGKWGAS